MMSSSISVTVYIVFVGLLVIANAQNVIRLTGETLYEEIQIQPLLLVNYYAPWCGYCQVLSTILDNVAVQLHTQNIPAKIAVVDASSDDMAYVLEQEHVDGFPTLVLYKDGQRLNEYQAQRTEKAIIDYLKLKSGPSAEYISSPHDLVPYIAQLERLETFEHGLFAVIIGVFPPSQESSDQSTNAEIKPPTGVYSAGANMFHEVAKVYDVAKFFYTDNPEFAKHFKISEDSMLVFTGEAHDTHHILPISKYQDIEQIYHDLTPLVMPVSIPYTETTRATIQSLPFQNHVLCFYDASGSDDLFLDNVLSVATKFKGKLLLMEVSSEDYTLLHYFNIRPSDLPQLIIMNMQDEEDVGRYRFVDYVANRRTYYASHPEAIDENKPIEAPSNQLKIKRISPSKLKETITTNTVTTKKPSRMPSRTGKKEDSVKESTTTTKTVNFEEVEGEEEIYYYNRQYIEHFFQEYLATIHGDSTDTTPVRFLERHVLTQDISVADKLNQDLVNLTPRVINIVGSQFHEKVNMANEQDVLVYFHAPWCIHCKTIEPIMSEVANYFGEDSSFVLYKMDGSKNEVIHDGVKVFAYPTIYFFPSNRYLVNDLGQVQTIRKPVKYDVEEGDGIGGILSTESMIHFIRTNRINAANPEGEGVSTDRQEEEGTDSSDAEGVVEEVTVEEVEGETSEYRDQDQEPEHVQLDAIVYEDEVTSSESSNGQIAEDGSVLLEEV